MSLLHGDIQWLLQHTPNKINRYHPHNAIINLNQHILSLTNQTFHDNNLCLLIPSIDKVVLLNLDTRLGMYYTNQQKFEDTINTKTVLFIKYIAAKLNCERRGVINSPFLCFYLFTIFSFVSFYWVILCILIIKSPWKLHQSEAWCGCLRL